MSEPIRYSSSLLQQRASGLSLLTRRLAWQPHGAPYVHSQNTCFGWASITIGTSAAELWSPWRRTPLGPAVLVLLMWESVFWEGFCNLFPFCGCSFGGILGKAKWWLIAFTAFRSFQEPNPSNLGPIHLNFTIQFSVNEQNLLWMCLSVQISLFFTYLNVTGYCKSCDLQCRVYHSVKTQFSL